MARDMAADFSSDLSAIAAIDAVPTILEVVCRTTGMGFAAVARVTEDRWIACGVRDEIDFGLKPGGELRVETTICDEIRGHRQLVVIDDVAKDERYCGHHTPATYGFQSYISMPITLVDGTFFGTLCAIDPQPRKLNTPEVVGMFKLFADLIAFHLDAHQRVATSATDLRNERATSELREQFIAVLGHDLRNPLASIDAGMTLLQRGTLDEKGKSVTALIQGTVRRMSGLIDNLMDFARGRLGGGLSLNRRTGSVQPVLDEIVAEFRTAWPDRMIETDFAAAGPVSFDPVRFGQLVSNLLANALAHGAADSPVRVTSMSDDERFTLAVVNRGETMPAGSLKDIFKPFVRASARSGQQGLGLGLYIASEIARAHGATISVTSQAGVTRFAVKLPCGDSPDVQPL